MATNTSAVNNRDTEIFNSNPTFNYGAKDELNIRAVNNTTTLRSLINFTLPANPGNGVISKITLTLTKSETETANGNVEVHALTQANWVEGTGTGSATGDGATWNTYDGTNNWTSAGGDFSATVINTVADPPNVGDLLNIDLYGGTATNPMAITWGSVVNLLLKQSNESPGSTDTGAAYYSKEDITSTNRPLITITYTNTLGASILLNLL